MKALSRRSTQKIVRKRHANVTISGLEQLLQSQSGKGPAPVERWNPPYCGDIGMKIMRDGTWLYQGSPIGRQALVKLFASVLRRDKDGRHYLVTSAEKIDIEVADAPFLAVEMEVRGEGRDQCLLFRTNLDDVVEVGPAHEMRFELDSATQGIKPYILVRGRLEALVTRALYYDLVALAVVEPRKGGDMLGVWSGGAFFEIAAAEAP